MPVAVRRLALGDLPASVTLGDADSVMPTRRLSDVGRVEVLARASVRGSANAGPGDLESAAVVLERGAATRLTIDRIRR
jgi:cytochrome c-type biogenesis protein CcmH